MPPAIGLIVSTLAWVGASEATLQVVSAVLSSAMYSAASQWLTSVIKGKPKSPDPGRSVDVRQPISPRRVIYGRAGRIGGVVTYIHLNSTTMSGIPSNQLLFIILTVSSHELQSMDALYFDDVLLPTGSDMGVGDGFLRWRSGQYSGHGAYAFKTGASNDGDFACLIPYSGGTWTSAHKQQGCGGVVLALLWSSEAYPNGIPNITVDVHGKKLYDPRTSTTAYSENPALAIRDYLTNKYYGLGCDTSEIDEASVIAAANICDETVSSRSGTEPRYTCNGSFTLDTTPADILKALADSMAGYVTYSQGKWRLIAGAWSAPTISLNDDDLRDAIKVQTLRSKRDLYNGFKGQFYNPSGNWQLTDFPPISDAFYIAEDSGFANVNDRGKWVTSRAYAINDCVLDTNGTRVFVCKSVHTSSSTTQPGVGASWTTYWTECLERIWNSQEFSFTISPSMCQRIANIRLQTNRNQITATLPCKMSAYQLQPGDTFNFTHDRFGWTNKTFFVLAADLVIDDKGSGGPAIGVDLQVQEWDSTIFAWDPATQENLMGTTPIVSMPPWQRPKPELPVIGYGSNICPNPGFESNSSGKPDNTPVDLTELIVDNWYVSEDFGGADHFAIVLDATQSHSGNRCLMIRLGTDQNLAANVWNFAVAQTPLLPCRPREVYMLSGFTAWWADTALPSGVEAYAYLQLRWLDADENVLSASNSTFTPRNAGWSLQTIKTLVPDNACYCRIACVASVYFTDPNPLTIWNTGTSLYLDARFDDIICSTDLASTQNQPPINTASTYTGPNPLSSTAGSTVISIAAFTIKWGFGTVSYNSGSVNPGSYGTYYIYCDDPTYAGGAVTYHSTTEFTDLFASDGRLYIGYITTSAGSGGGGGGGGGGGCFTGETEIIGYGKAIALKDVRVGDFVLTGSGNYLSVDAIHEHDFDGELVDMGEAGAGTESHHMLDDGAWVPAGKVFRKRKKFRGKVYNLTVKTNEPIEERWSLMTERSYVIAGNSRVVHNAKAPWT